MQSYTTIQGGATARLVEKKSEFIASASFADREEGEKPWNLAPLRRAGRSARRAYLAVAQSRSESDRAVTVEALWIFLNRTGIEPPLRARPGDAIRPTLPTLGRELINGLSFSSEW